MKTAFSTPRWVQVLERDYGAYDSISPEKLDALRSSLARFKPEAPVVSIVICAWNEEDTIAKTLASLAELDTSTAVEILVVNNNSTDRTAELLERIGVNSPFQPIQGWGPARQMGQEVARGKYILLADADCLYPEQWVDRMLSALRKPGVACVYGRYAFIPEPGFPRWKLALLEAMKNAIAEYRHWKRPYLNAYGMNMGYVRKLGLKAGFVMHKVRGEDGRMAFDLMQHGKVVQVKSSAATIWTSPRTLQRDGSFGQALRARLIREVKRFRTMLTPQPAHDTKVSTND